MTSVLIAINGTSDHQAKLKSKSVQVVCHQIPREVRNEIRSDREENAEESSATQRAEENEGTTTSHY